MTTSLIVSLICLCVYGIGTAAAAMFFNKAINHLEASPECTEKNRQDIANLRAFGNFGLVCICGLWPVLVAVGIPIMLLLKFQKPTLPYPDAHKS